MMLTTLVKRFPLHPPEIAELELPDFNSYAAPTAEIRRFMRSFIYLHMPDYFYRLSYFWIPFIAIIFLLAFATLMRRIYLGQLWVLRMQTAPNGQIFFAPHTINAFVVFDIFYAGGCVFFLVHMILMFRFNYNPIWLPYWLSFLWLAVATAGWYSAWGVFYTSPSIFSLRNRAKSFWDPRWWMPTPFISNIIMFVGPLVLIALVVGISFPWLKYYGESTHMLQSWDKAFGMQQDDAAITAEQRAGALAIWEHFELCFWWGSIVFLIWCLFAWLFGLFYFCSGLFLIRTILSQINIQKTLGTDAIRAQAAADVVGPKPLWTTTKTTVDDEFKVASPGLQEGSPSGRRGSASTRDTLRVDGPEADERKSLAKAEAERRRTAALQARTLLDDEAAAIATSHFFPSLRADVATREELAQRSSDTKVKLLQKALHNLVWMWGGVIVAIIILAACATVAAVAFVPRTVKGPQAWNDLLFGIVQAIQWLNCVCGIIIFILIATQAFEPVIEGLRRSNANDDDLESRGLSSHRPGSLSSYYPHALRRLWKRRGSGSSPRSGVISGMSATRMTSFFETRTKPQHNARTSDLSEDAGPFSYAERLRLQNREAEPEDALTTIGYASSIGANELEQICEEEDGVQGPSLQQLQPQQPSQRPFSPVEQASTAMETVQPRRGRLTFNV